MRPTTDRRALLAELADARAEVRWWRQREEAKQDPATEAEFNRQTLINALKGK